MLRKFWHVYLVYYGPIMFKLQESIPAMYWDWFPFSINSPLFGFIFLPLDQHPQDPLLRVFSQFLWYRLARFCGSFKCKVFPPRVWPLYAYISCAKIWPCSWPAGGEGRGVGSWGGHVLRRCQLVRHLHQVEAFQGIQPALLFFCLHGKFRGIWELKILRLIQVIFPSQVSEFPLFLIREIWFGIDS